VNEGRTDAPLNRAPPLVGARPPRWFLMQTGARGRPPAGGEKRPPAGRHPPVPASDSFVRSAAELRSGDAQRAIEIAGTLGPEDWALAPLLINLLAWDPAMPAARDALRRMGSKIPGMLLAVLLDPDRDFTVRRRLPRLLAP